MTLYDYLKTQFTDLDGAKAFAWRWHVEMKQEIPGFGLYSMRAMAEHISNVLTERDMDVSTPFTTYLNTEHGPDIYFAMCEPQPVALAGELDTI